MTVEDTSLVLSLRIETLEGEVSTDLLEQQNQQPSKISEKSNLSIKPILSRIKDYRFNSDGNIEILVR
jgi:hypothetical protein